MHQGQPFHQRTGKKGRGKPPSQQTVFKSHNFTGGIAQSFGMQTNNFAQMLLSNIAAAGHQNG